MLNLSRQSKLVPADKLAQTRFMIFGLGSIGSHVAKTLGKMGAKSIDLFDMDTVEEENIAPQAYDFSHIGLTKVEAMKRILMDSCGLEATGHEGIVDEKTEIVPEPNTIYCCFFDSLEARKILFDKVKDYPTIFIDTRIGRYDMRHYLVDCSDETQRTNYAKTIDPSVVSELQCGEKASAPINIQLSGRVCMNIVNYLSGKDYTKVFIGNAEKPKNVIEVIEKREVQDGTTEDSGDDVSEEIPADTNGTVPSVSD